MTHIGPPWVAFTRYCPIPRFLVSTKTDVIVTAFVETVQELAQLVKGTPKSDASVRKTVLPQLVIAELRRRLDRDHADMTSICCPVTMTSWTPGGRLA